MSPKSLSRRRVSAAGLAEIPKLGTFIPNMGTKISPETLSTPVALADALFTPVQQRVLGLLFGQPRRRFQSAELIRLADAGTGATHRVLKRLAVSGLAWVSVEGRQKYYQANAESPVFQELCGLAEKSLLHEVGRGDAKEARFFDERRGSAR